MIGLDQASITALQTCCKAFRLILYYRVNSELLGKQLGDIILVEDLRWKLLFVKLMMFSGKACIKL
jgi:hypothetical protein